MAKKNSSPEPTSPDGPLPELYALTGEGPLLVVGKVIRRTKRDFPRSDGEVLTLVTYEIQALSGEIARVSQAGTDDCLAPGAVVSLPVYVTAYVGKSGPVASLRRKQATGTEF